MQKILDTFVEDIRTAYKENLRSIILYGSKANSEDAKKYSDYNLMIVLNTLAFKDLNAMQKAIAPLVKLGNQPPQMFTLERLKRSTDVFPIEFLDIKSNHRVLHGEDPFTDLVIHDTNLRHECEFELKGKLLKLNQGFMMYSGKDAKLREFLISTISTFLIVFRYVLQLTGENTPVNRIDALGLLATKVGFDPAPFLAIHNMKHGDKDALKLDVEALAEKYMQEIEKVVDFVDAFEVK